MLSTSYKFGDVLRKTSPFRNPNFPFLENSNWLYFVCVLDLEEMAL
jgi:hypothetical protein